MSWRRSKSVSCTNRARKRCGTVWEASGCFPSQVAQHTQVLHPPWAHLLGASGSAVIALLQHLRGLSLLDNHNTQAVPDQALHAVQVLGLREAAVRLVALGGIINRSPRETAPGRV